MKSLSIGSPFLSYIRLTNNSPSIAMESSSIMTLSAMLAMKEFAPRLFRDHLKQVSGLKVTVNMYHSVETWAGFLAKTGWQQTLDKANRICLDRVLPAFTPAKMWSSAHVTKSFGARVSRLDITCNFATGSESQARTLIRWLANRSVSRMKKGRAGDESVWWVNTRHMLKAYIKHIEMLKHGCSPEDPVYLWCKKQGVVRVEIELKKRLLFDEGLNTLENITDEKLIKAFNDETEIFKRVDRSDEPDIMDAIPVKSRVYASAWLAGNDLSNLASRATLFRHAKILREYGMDIMEPRNVEQFPVKVQIVDLKPLSMLDWYSLDEEKPMLKVVGE